MATKTEAQSASVKKTVPGYAGVGASEGVPPDTKIDKPEGTVIGQDGTLTYPAQAETTVGFHKSPTKEKRYAGKVLMEGDTFHGYHYKQIAEITEALTLAGVFNTFRGHYPDAIREGFSCKAVSEEEATKLMKQWAEEKNRTPKEKK